MNVVRTLDGLEGTCRVIRILFPLCLFLAAARNAAEAARFRFALTERRWSFSAARWPPVQFWLRCNSCSMWELVCAIPALKRITASATAASTANSDACFSFGARLQIRECSASFAFWVLPLWQRCFSLLSARRWYTGSSALLTFSGSL